MLGMASVCWRGWHRLTKTKERKRHGHARFLWTPPEGVQVSVYGFALDLTANSPERTFAASVDTLADATGYHSETVQAALKDLLLEGWLKSLGRYRKIAKSSDRLEPNEYRVVRYGDWIKKNASGRGGRGTKNGKRMSL